MDVRGFGKWLGRIWRTTTRLDLAVVLLVGIPGVGAFIFPMVLPDSETRYHGHILEYWLNEYRRTESGEAYEAVRALPGPALAAAERLFTTNRANSRRALAAWPKWIDEQPLFCELAADSTPQREYEESIWSLELLGEKARPLLPLIVEKLNDPRLFSSAAWGLDQIVGVDREVELAMRRGSPTVKVAALRRIEGSGWIERMEKTLAQASFSETPAVRAKAMELLLAKGLHGDSEAHQRLLLRGLRDGSARVQVNTLNYLARNPGEIWLAMAEVKALTNSTTCRTQALCALRAARLIKRDVVDERMIPPPDARQRIAKNN